jgi:hypothetical protein
VTRRYYPRRVGLRWEVWFANADDSPDPANGAVEWRALWGIRVWRRLTALRLASELHAHFHAGLWLGENLTDVTVRLPDRPLPPPQ